MLKSKIVELLNKITRYHVISISGAKCGSAFIECAYSDYLISFFIEDVYGKELFSKKVNIRALNEEAVIADLEEIVSECVKYFGELE